MGSNSVVAAWTQQAVIRSGFTPDVIVDNLPAATHRGEDAQLTAAITTLQALLRGRSLLAGDSPLPSPPVRYFVAAAGSERRRRGRQRTSSRSRPSTGHGAGRRIVSA